MRYFLVLALILGATNLYALKKKPKAEDLPPPCVDEEAMPNHYRKELTDLTAAVKQEGLGDFERQYHRKKGKNFLTFWSIAVESAVACYETAAQEPTTTKKLRAEMEAKREAATLEGEQLKEMAETLKRARSPKAAKAVIEGFEVPGASEASDAGS